MIDSKELEELLNEGVALTEQGKLDESIAIFKNIGRKDSSELYAKAQFLLGTTLKKKGASKEAIKAYKNVKSEDSPEFYAKAQFNLGVIHGEKGDLEEAIAMFQNGKYKDSPEVYANAQLNLGFFLGKKGEIEKAITAYQNVEHHISPFAYAMMRNNLGTILGQKGEIEKSINIFKDIKRKDNPKAYAYAQFNLSISFKKKGYIKEAIDSLKRIKHEDSPETYSHAQFKLGEIYKKQEKPKTAIKHYYKSCEYFYFEANVNINILKINKKKIRSMLFNINETSSKLIDNLRISSSLEDELKFSHYTQSSIAWNIINKLSAFRLGLIKNVNDPMEGLTLHKFLQQSCLLPEGFFNHSKTTTPSEYVFISCFTFNHDSLNQFRLYGKENNQEASGVSMVFPRDFFNFSSKNHINSIIDFKDNKVSDNLKEQKDNKENNLDDKNNLSRQPLYRCVYIEPYIGYVSLARRDKATFYRELYAGGKSIEEISKEADDRWTNYISSITNKEKETKEYLKHISNEIKEISRLKKISEEEKKYIFEVLHFILLPLQYLVKHAAFEEEQECRMIYITSLDNKKIQLDWESKQVYIEYEPKVNDYLDKIYLSPGALIYEDFFRHELDDPNNPKKRVRISSNPFRNK